MNVKQILLTCLMWSWTSAETPAFFVKRHYKGDLFEHSQGPDCSLDMCSVPERHAVPVPWKKCQCQCLPPTPTFRQDTGTCVDNVDECQLVPFQSPVDSENIPLVSMPDSGKYVHPSAEIVLGKVANQFNDVVCHVLVERYLSPSGWLPLLNLSLTGPTFQLVHNSKKIFLQFVGGEQERSSLDGHLILVEFSCKTKNKANIVPHPCAAFRVAGKLSMVGSKDVLVAVEQSTGRWRDWIIIGLGAGLLGVTYVLAILVYVVVRKRHERKIATSSQLQCIRAEHRPRDDQESMKTMSTWSEITLSDCSTLDAKFNSRMSLSGALPSPSCDERQSGPSRLLSQLRGAWNSATTKLRGRRLTFSSSLLDIRHESASSCRSVKSSESASRCQSPRSIGSDDSSCRSLSSHSKGPHPRMHDEISDPVPLISSLRRSSNKQSHYADGSARIAIVQKMPEPKKKKPWHISGPEPHETFMDRLSSETLGGSEDQSKDNIVERRCSGHCHSLTDSARRKAASCDNITVLTVVGESGPETENWKQKKLSRSNSQQGGWETIVVSKGNGYHSLRRGQEISMSKGRSVGYSSIGRSESTCSIDGKRKSVSFDLRDTVILGDELSGKEPSEVAEKDQQLSSHFNGREDRLPLEDSGMCRSEIHVRKMTSFAKLRRQSTSNEFLHLNDQVRIGRSESSAGDYGIGAVQRLMLENGEAQPLPSILKRTDSRGNHGRSTAVSRSHSVTVHPNAVQRQVRLLSHDLERVQVKSLLNSFNRNTSGPENKRVWQVVNDDSGYHSSDSDKSLKKCGAGTVSVEENAISPI